MSDSSQPTASNGKGRPTPSRKEREAARKKPLIGDRSKEAKKAARAQLAAKRAEAREGMLNGEERYLTARDRGPQKKLARDMVDSRFTVGELLLPVVFVAVILNTVNNDLVNLAAILIMWSIMGGMIVDAILLSRRVTKRLTAKYGEANLERGLKMYVALRSMQMRPMRLPKPQVKRGTVI
ncbi:MAG: hypothetical protein RLZZ514_62 [Actinomycetota bacterium]|jgi:hypothetical protein